MHQSTRNDIQGRNFLFERSDLNRRTPTILFEKWEFEQVNRSNSSTNFLSQFNLSHKQTIENMSDSFYTPPMEKKSIPTPKAPVKYKKQPKKGDLKPKKLYYTDDELDASNTIDSGIHIPFDESNNSLFHKHTTRCNRFDSSQKQIRRLRAKLDRIKVQTNDKENDRNVLGNRSVNVVNNRNNVAQESSVVFNPSAEGLFQYDFNWKEKLYWLQPKRDIGLWIECCRKNCKKWRYVEEYHDPLNVPKIWYCEMNYDKSMASCNIPEHPNSFAIKSNLIENAYNAGSIVWAHMKGFPWWPGIINDCPDTFTYYKLPKNSLIPIKYYVTFFNEEKLECAWIHKQSLKPFAIYKYDQLIKKTKFHGINYKQSLKKAYKIATNALSLSILERLREFSFLPQYEKFYDINNNSNQLINNTTKRKVLLEMDTNSDNEIPCTNPIKKQYTLKEYYLRIICKNQEI
ncbi:zinc finger CW-type PWWP domain protein 1 [Apis mellifera caucasica]|uniref:Zinc finger CW-type PWWP domain protein 1 n=1 Tax=Apis mellifera TaxID=7460 RepID=A0A7M7MQ88_APIME|nr:zinc finger CW-type PWWP domain protein 1 [Apis mellifera]KAG6798332.1 zinc finger CW-type PWWP domain protein 1 [Apis mellifera caucasica]|eukprot:XP_026299370.1 zinc finger CW-type PWWP domain protein 1 [Apis mellifera]